MRRTTRLVDDDLFDLPPLKHRVVAAFDVRVVDQHSGRLGLQGDSSAASGLIGLIDQRHRSCAAKRNTSVF